jgi:hypothetical protein
MILSINSQSFSKLASKWFQMLKSTENCVSGNCVFHFFWINHQTKHIFHFASYTSLRRYTIFGKISKLIGAKNVVPELKWLNQLIYLIIDLKRVSDGPVSCERKEPPNDQTKTCIFCQDNYRHTMTDIVHFEFQNQCPVFKTRR